MSCQEAPGSLSVNTSTAVLPKEGQSLSLQPRRTLGSKVKEHQAALQHVREWEDLQEKEQEVMSTVYITLVQHNQAALYRQLLCSILRAASQESDALSLHIYPGLSPLAQSPWLHVFKCVICTFYSS